MQVPVRKSVDADMAKLVYLVVRNLLFGFFIAFYSFIVSDGSIVFDIFIAFGILLRLGLSIY